MTQKQSREASLLPKREILIVGGGTRKLVGKDSIYESGYLRIGGIDQWVQMRGCNVGNPIILWLHGGPGDSTIPWTARYSVWERSFTVVMWDQRGAGKTFAQHGRALSRTMSISQMTADGIELAEYLQQRLGRAPIVLLGHSWGSILGIHMVRSRPDLFAAYVGTGQVTHYADQLEAAYPRLLKRAARLQMKAAREELLSSGSPSVLNGARSLSVASKWAIQIELASQTFNTTTREPLLGPTPQQSPPYLLEGRQFSTRFLSRAIALTDLATLGTTFSIPMCFFQGIEDLLTTTSVVRLYFDELTADRKAFVTLPASGHLTVFFKADMFLRALTDLVRPMFTTSEESCVSRQ